MRRRAALRVKLRHLRGGNSDVDVRKSFLDSATLM